MLCRAKFSVLFTLVGALSASGALLNPEQRNATFQPGGRNFYAKPAVLRPATATVQAGRWSGAGVQAITPSHTALVRVDLNGVKLAKAGDAAITPGVVRKAGGGQ